LKTLDKSWHFYNCHSADSRGSGAAIVPGLR
jgi:hypothetical protein